MGINDDDERDEMDTKELERRLTADAPASAEMFREFETANAAVVEAQRYLAGFNQDPVFSITATTAAVD